MCRWARKQFLSISHIQEKEHVEHLNLSNLPGKLSDETSLAQIAPLRYLRHQYVVPDQQQDLLLSDSVQPEAITDAISYANSAGDVTPTACFAKVV